MILTDRQIREAIEAGDIVIEPFDEKQIQPATYDLRVGGSGATTTAKKKVNIKDTGFLLLEHGDFGVLTVFEEIRLSTQYTARIGLRSKYARKGLIATTGPQIDPGYEGRLIIGITNLTPRTISLSYMDDFLSIEFHRLAEPVEKPYSGPYQGRVDIGPEELEFIAESEGMALSDMMNTLRSLSDNVGTLTAQLKVLYWAVPLIMMFGILIISIIVGLK